MKKIINIFFVVLGVIFLLIIIFAIYFYIADPLNLKPLLFNTTSGSTTSDNSVENSSLSESQQKALETFGIDPTNIPNQFTPEQVECFEEKLGIERVKEIQDGDSPSATEYYKARDCMK